MTITAKINHENILRAAKIIKSGGLVAFPTETVYGLGADALNPEAVKKIYEAKGRPSDNPLILHVSSYQQASSLVYMNSIAEKLIANFWPGALTLVLNSKSIVPLSTRGGLETAAIRMPDNFTAQELIKACELPIAAPSANLSGRPSPTDFESVFHDLNGRIDMILDGGKVKVGIESTVIDVTNPKKILMLRPGGLGRELIEEVLKMKLETPNNDSKKRSPGTRYKHYAPNIPVIIWKREKNFELPDPASTGYIGLHDPEIELGKKILFTDTKNYAHELFSAFRKLEADKYSCIVCEWPEESSGVGEGLRDRIKRAAGC